MSNPERSPKAPWSIPVRVDDVPETGLRTELTADNHVRDAVAALAGLRTLPRLQAVFELSRRGHGGLRVTGQVSATVGQTCVVTLDPIENSVEETVDLAFARPSPGAGLEEIAAVVDALPEEGPEPLVNGTVDLAAIAIEFLILGLDPYPRKPDAVFAPPPPRETIAGPFSGLAALKVGRKSDGSN
jgi:uncharacterized metal-binding protein YceD (DUF177 family)